MLYKRLTALLLCLLLIAGATPALAVPAAPVVVTITENASGESVRIRQIGDEFFSYMTTEDGLLIVEDAQGWLRYVVEANGAYALGASVTGASVNALTATQGGGSAVRAYADGLRSKLTALNADIDANRVRPLRGSSERIPANYNFLGDKLEGKVKRYTDEEFAKITPPDKGSSVGLVVLKVEFENVKAAFSDAEWHKRLFNDGVAQYYSTVSNGVFTYEPAKETSGTVDDGVIDVLLPFNALLYTTDTTTNQNADTGLVAGLYTGTDTRKYAIYNEASVFAYAVDQAAAYMDIADYDKNKDGYISPTELAFIMVYAGYEVAFCSQQFCEGKPAVWAHSWVYNSVLGNTPGNTPMLMTVEADGVECYKYTLMGENYATDYDYYHPDASKAVQAQYGTACHELGHDLGLMDLYDVYYQNLKLNVDDLSLMAGGGWGRDAGQPIGSSPTHIDPYDKLFLGFYNAELATQEGTYTLNATEPASRYNILCIKTSNPDIFYLLENRAFVGYDRGLTRLKQSLSPGGVLIWRVDMAVVRNRWNSNTINTVEGHYGIMPVFLDETLNNPYYMQLPFWGGDFAALRASLLLPDEPTIKMIAEAPAGTTTTVQLAVVATPTPTPVPVPSTGDGFSPMLWLATALAALSFAALLLLMERKRRADRS